MSDVQILPNQLAVAGVSNSAKVPKVQFEGTTTPPISIVPDQLDIRESFPSVPVAKVADHVSTTPLTPVVVPPLEPIVHVPHTQVVVDTGPVTGPLTLKDP
jgi:hypothetical protein